MLNFEKNKQNYGSSEQILLLELLGGNNMTPINGNFYSHADFSEVCAS